MKTCNKCGEEKPLDAFSMRKRTSGQLAPIGQCKKCVTLKTKLWTEQNSERRKEWSASYRSENRSEIYAKDAEYRAKNRESILERKRHRYTEKRSDVLTANAAWRAANPEKLAEAKRAYYLKNSEQIRNKTSQYYQENRDAMLAAGTRRWAARPLEYRREKATKQRDQRAANPDSFRDYYARYRDKNRPAYRAARARYRAQKFQATPVWANLEEILEIYECAAAATELFGVPYHVDHIVPLCSELVCGLHVSANLRVIPGKENLSKKNRYWPDMP